MSEQNREQSVSGKDRVMATYGNEGTAIDTRRSVIKIYYPTLTRKAERPF
ncbi:MULTISPECIES: hypothetical protein [unclassified Chamaesiphon]|nr:MULTISPECIES: hypothetical protein [unclassified Chamaesiphon]